MIYQVPFAYERYGRIEVEANDPSEALTVAAEKLRNMSAQEMDACSSYLEDSEEIDEEGMILDANGNVIDE